MWLERLQADDGEWVHGALTLAPGAASDWDPGTRNTVNRALETLAIIDQATLSKRVVFAPATGVTLTYQCMVPATAAAGLEACWSTLENLGSQKGNLHIPASPAEFDPMLASTPSLQALIGSPRYRSGNTWLACRSAPQRPGRILPRKAPRSRIRTKQHMAIRSICTATVPRPHNCVKSS